MTGRAYPFRIGSIDCAVLLDGASIIGRDRILKRFPDRTEAEYRSAYAEIGLSLDEADSSMNILALKMDREAILIDAGEAGRPNGGFLRESLRLAAIAPDSVTLVILTHSHGDHVQGLIQDDGSATFPNARYFISEAELGYWQQRIETGTAEHSAILRLMKMKGLNTGAMDAEILPGVTAVPIPGHTPGQIAVHIESENGNFIHMADLLHSPMQFAHPDWSAYFDADTTVSVPTRQTALQYTANRKMLSMFYHLTFPGLGYVRHAENGFAWEPVSG